MHQPTPTMHPSERFMRIKKELLGTKPSLDIERALLVTEYFKHHDDPRDPMSIRKAKALHYVLSRKSVRIYPYELIVGNMGKARISAIMQPELASVFMSEDLLWIERRKTTPLQISWPDRIRLLTQVLPYWLRRNMPVRVLGLNRHRLRYVREQMRPVRYLINEAGGIGHFLPHYEKVLAYGINGYLESFREKRGAFYTAVRIACDGLLVYAERLAAQAQVEAYREHDPVRKTELEHISHICRKVPRLPATTFHEALQSLWLTHMAVNLEGLNSAVSFGRLDQYLYPYYRSDLQQGRLTREGAKELLLCFTAKAAEHVFLLSERISHYHGGHLVVQAAIVGGMDAEGNDAVNDLTYVLLDVMEEAGLRDPNYQVRVHSQSPLPYLQRVAEVARAGNGMPAVFNDDAVVPCLIEHGYPLREVRKYAVVGCVEPALPGKSFFSTDAALCNLPLCLELALNQGYRVGHTKRIGAPTPDPLSFEGMSDVIEAFSTQVDFMVDRMVEDLRIMEAGNRLYHPTPFSSMLVDGCLEKGKDLTEGGALYNASGIQGVGVADVADALAALDEVVFTKQRYTLEEVVQAIKVDFRGYSKMQAELSRASKYGNDEALPDRYADKVVRIFYDALARYRNTRGGPYVPGFYSVTCHVAFGAQVAALPSGRNAGRPLAASLGPANGSNRCGPTALLRSVTRIDTMKMPNGCAVNVSFSPATLEGPRGIDILVSLIKGYFSQGGIQMQFNILDPVVLEDARRNPGRYPGLVVRVAGYCAYFDDLPDPVKEEIISRVRRLAC